MEKPDKETLRELYREDLHTLEEIARMYWVSKTKVIKWMREYDIDTYDRQESKKIKKKKWKKEAEDFIQNVADDRFPHKKE